MKYNEKIEKAKKNLEGLKSKPNNSAQVFANSDMESLYHKFNDMQDVISKVLDTTNKQADVISKSTHNKLVDMNNSLVTLSEALLQKGMHINNLKDIEKIKSVSVDNLADIKIPKTVTIDKIPDWIASNESIKEVNKNLGLIANQLNDLDVNLKPGQTPGDFLPIRRVVSDGKTLRFDDSSWTGARGGGGSGGGGSTSEVNIHDAAGNDLNSTGGSLDVNITGGAGSGGTASADDADFTAGTTPGTPSMGVYESTPTSVTDGDLGTVGITSGRRLKTSATIDAALPAGTNAIGKLAANSGVDIGDVDVTSSALPTGASTSAKQDTVIGHLDGVETLLGTIDADTGTIAGAVSGTEVQVDIVTAPTLTVNSHAVTNAGTFATQVDGAALTALQKIDDPVLVDDAAFTPATSSVMMSGFQADEASTDSVDEGDAGAARMTLDRKVITTPQPHTTGGLTIFRSLDLDESEEEVKASAGQVYSLWFTNTATSTRWLKFYNATAANVTVGTTTPVMTLGLPGNTSDDISGVFGGAFGFAFDTAITVAATTGVADNDTGAPSANDVIVNIGYK